MSDAVQKVTAFVTRDRDRGRDLLLFKHPTAGIQLPAGTVEFGEDLETAVIRETQEETGLRETKIQAYLGRYGNELTPEQRIVAQSTHVLSEPALNAIPFKWKFNRGLRVRHHQTVGTFTEVSYTEYDRYPDPKYILFRIAGWLPNSHLRAQSDRHFFHLTTLETTAEQWQLKSDADHVFEPFWTPVAPKPLSLVEAQQRWLDFVYAQII